MRLADYGLKIPWVCCCITCHTWPNFTYALLSLLIVSLSHFCISHFRICSSLIHSSLRFSSLRVEIHHHLKKTMKKSTQKIMEEYSIPDDEEKLDKALKGSVIPDWHIMPLHFYRVNHDQFVGLVPNRVYFIPTFRKSLDKNKIFFPNSYQLLSIFYFKRIPEFFQGLDMECDHGDFLDVTNAKFDDCSFWIETEYLVGDKFKLLHVESLKDLEVPIKGLEVDVKRMRKLLDKAYRNLALKKNSDFEFLSTLIDDKIDVNSGNDDSECDDVEVGLVDDEGFEKMCCAFHHTEKLLNWYKNLMVRIKVKLEDLNGAVCLLPQDSVVEKDQDSVVEKDAPELVFNIMKTTGTGGAQLEIATSIATSEEHDTMVGALVNPKRPFAAIIGGSKMSSKIGLIESLLAKLDILVLGGGTCFTFYKAMGFSVGSSLVEEDKLDLATSLLEKAKYNEVLVLLPTDLVIADKYAADANSKIIPVSSIPVPVSSIPVPVSSIPDGWMGLDIGPDSVTTFSETLDVAETVIWNGPMGVVEFEKFAVGTKAMVTKLAKLSRKGVRTFIGGGDSIAVVEKAGLADRMIYKSTGGTVGLELLVELAADKTI